MRKLFTLAAMLLLMVVSANAKQKVCDLSTLPSSSENTTWTYDVATGAGTFAWSQTYYNSMEIFGTGDYSAYETLNYTAEEGTTDHFRIIIKYKNGVDQTTYSPAKMGTASLTWAQLGVSADNVPYISTIRISGANDCTANVKISSIYLEGPDVVTYDPVTLYPQNATELSKLTGTNTSWASTVSYPKEFKTQGLAFGDGDGSNKGTYVTISDYESLTFVVSEVSGNGNALRVWIWDDANSKVVTLYPYPADQYETADFTTAYTITEPGFYKVNVSGYDYLKGVKAANDWSYPSVYVNYAYATPLTATNEYAVDEARTYSSAKILDFTDVEDVEAYIATSAADDKVVMKKVTGAIPAHTGIVLKQVNTNSTLSIPTCGEATEDVSANLLVATTAATTVEKAATGTNYVLGGTGSTLGWYSIDETSATLAANKCYLAAPASAAKQLVMVWDDPIATAAEAVKAVETVGNAAYYTVAGVKVTQPVKGNLYIHNGKAIVF